MRKHTGMTQLHTYKNNYVLKTVAKNFKNCNFCVDYDIDNLTFKLELPDNETPVADPAIIPGGCILDTSQRVF